MLRSAELGVLESFHLACEGQTVRLPMSAQRVLVFLALHDRPLQRLYVAGSLWLDQPEERAQASLRSALWRINRCGYSLVEVSTLQLALGREVQVDLRAAATLARRVLGDPSLDPLAVDTSLLYKDLLPDWYEDWLVVKRESHRQVRLHALETLCERLVHAEILDRALEVGLAAVAAEPLRESAHRAVVSVHLEEGNTIEAIRHYRLYRQLLSTELGLEPSERMELLVRELDGAQTMH